MTLATIMSVGEVALKSPHATRILDEYGIDYCCGGARSLAEACSSKDIDADQLLRAIEQAGNGCGSNPTKDYSSLSQRALVDHIVGTHHVFTSYELARLSRLIEKVVAAHGDRHLELLSVRDLFHKLYEDLAPHLAKEEDILFPHVIELEAAAERGSPCPKPRFVTVANPIQMMQLEHETAGELLRQMRFVTANYKVPADGCASYAALYAALDHFEKDLHQHIHLESNILFPRAIEMERMATVTGYACVDC